MSKTKVAVIVQRCHKDIVGGSESLAWQYATLLSKNFDVDILTTCALSSHTWQNELPDGRERQKRVTIQRFEVTTGRTPGWEKLHHLLVSEFQNQKEIKWTRALQEEWIRTQGPYSEELLTYLNRNHYSYQALIFITYLYAPSYFGILAVPRSKVILVPTLHDEPAAYLPIFKAMANRTSRLLWNTVAEERLGRQLWGELPGEIVSMGVKINPVDEPLIGTGPYLLYSGRIDAGKGCDQLFEYFIKYNSENQRQLKLILTGELSMELPKHPDLEYRGFVSENEKLTLMAGATALVMPSVHESLSVVVLEAMSQKTPVLVTRQSPVLAEHLNESGGGLGFLSYHEFSQSLSKLLDDKALRQQLGASGQNYVRERYSLEKIQEKLIAVVESLS